MKKMFCGSALSLLLGLALPYLAQAQNDSNEPKSLATEEISGTATVTDVSSFRHLVTLKDSDGNTIRLKVGKENADLVKQLHKGDQVAVDYYRSVAVSLGKAAQEPTGRQMEEFVLKPENAGQPGKVIVNAIKTTATVEKIDPKKRDVTLREPGGHRIKVKVDQLVPDLDQIKQGDQVTVTYTEAAAISVTKKQT